MVPKEARRPFQCKLVFEDLEREKAAINEAHRRWAEEEERKKKPEEEQVESSHAKEALWSKFKNYFTRKKQEKLPQGSQLKSTIVDREGRQIYSEHVGHQAFKKLIQKVKRWKRRSRWNSIASTNSYRKEKLLEFFSTYDTTENIFVFLRLVAAIQICSHREDYEPLISGLRENYTLKDWCFRRVTPSRKFTDHVMMTALVRALEVPLKVERLYGGCAQDIYTGPGVPHVSVTLLYTGNHYDIIYPRAPSAESSGQQASQREHHAD